MYRPVYLCHKLLLVLLVRAAAGTELTVDLSNDCDQEHARKKLHFMFPNKLQSQCQTLPNRPSLLLLLYFVACGASTPQAYKPLLFSFSFSSKLQKVQKVQKLTNNFKK